MIVIASYDIASLYLTLDFSFLPEAYSLTKSGFSVKFPNRILSCLLDLFFAFLLPGVPFLLKDLPLLTPIFHLFLNRNDTSEKTSLCSDI